jgi:hypothetical protein
MDGFPYNYVRLQGYLDKLKLIELGGGNYMLKGSVKVPIQHKDSEDITKLYYNYINIVVFGDLAAEIYSLGKGSWAVFEGNIEISRYNKKCYKCKNSSSAYWTEVRVSNFVPVDKPELLVDFVYDS